MQHSPYTVVVGVSAAPQSSAALRWAAEQVTQRGGRLVVVRVLRVSGPQATPAPTGAGRIRTAHDAVDEDRALLEKDVERALGADHGAELRVVRGGRRRALLAAAEEADLLVIDTPRATATSPLLAQRLARTTPCPVVVVPPVADPDPADLSVS